MISKLLIANRGEIACRIIKSARKMGIATVAVYSDADANALHVRLADEAVHLGPAPAKESYLRIERILELASQLNVDAIHPGYGFLSENAHFARACKQAGIIFVGPPAEAIEAMGSKSAAKAIMEQAGVPLVPGYHGDDQSEALLQQSADEMGYPVLLKAAAGGGGKGMRVVNSQAEFSAALAAAKREASASFGDDIMLVEKYLTQPRHVEIQVFCDSQGNGVYLFERDCSVQRRHQKVIEEAPAPGLSEETRKAMGEAALKAAQAINYVGAGTVEFLFDVDGSFYFMEMNTRLQVEHPVTEMITGEDLVAWQLQVASGEPLPKQQSELRCHGHAFEARIYAEDPDNQFLPATGTLSLLQPPHESAHVRVDTGVVEGDEVSVYYDPMIAKLVVWDENRDKALQQLLRALRAYHINGVTTNIEFLYNVAASQPFRGADLVTTFIEKHQDQLYSNNTEAQLEQLPLMALVILLEQRQKVPTNNNDPYSPWSLSGAWRANEQHQQVLSIQVADVDYQLNVEYCQGDSGAFVISYQQHCWQVKGEWQGDQVIATIDGHRLPCTVDSYDGRFTLYTHQRACHFTEQKPDLGTQSDSGDGGFTAPMNGTVIELQVATGEAVKKGTTLLIMEAMKMEHNIVAPVDGKVTEFFCNAGDLVDGGSVLLEFAADE